MTRINTNVSSLVAQNTLGRSNASLNEALTRLSTGLRINTGKDDPAGLIASENLRSDITAIRKAISNTDRANQVIATADSALGQVSSLLNDIRGLVTESANSGALSDEQLAANQLQVDSSLEALNRIAQTTTFQGRRLLDGSLDFITTAGANFTSVSDLNIDQANLGATGTVSVNLKVTSAATKAQIDVANIPNTQTAATGDLTLDIITTQGVASDGQIDFDVITTEAVGATGNTTFTFGTGAADAEADTGTGANAIQLTGSGAQNQDIQITAVDGGDLDGLAGNLSISIIDEGPASVGNSPTVNLNGSTLEIHVESGTTTAQNIVDALNAFDEGTTVGADFSASLVAAQDGGAIVVNAGDAGANGQLTGGTQVTDTAQLDIVSEGGALASALTVQIQFGGAASSGIVVSGTAGSGGTLTVTLEDNVDHTLDAIAAALQNHAGIESASFATNGTATINSATGGAAGTGDAAPANASVTGGTDAVTETVSFGLTGELTSGEDGNIEISFATAAIAAGTANVISNGVNGSGQNRYIVQLSNAGDVSLGTIRTALEGIAEVDTASILGTPTATAISTFDAGGDPDAIDTLPAAVTLANGVTEVVTQEVINITAAPGGEGNVNIGVAFADLSGVGTTVSGNATSGYTLTIDTTVNVSLATITTALESITEVDDATISPTSPGGGTASYQSAITDPQAVPTAVQLQGGADNGLTEDLVIELSGSTGAEVLAFEAGTSITQLVNGINLVADATGVGAVANGTTLELTSTAYGSSAFVDIKVISEGAGSNPSGVFTTEIGQGDRATGADVAAAINGVSATGNGNRLSINTATLDLNATVDEGFTGTITFGITGGGALFQLGPDVVSNQQARLGIKSVNTARLGGTSGRLFQLGTGGTASLTADTTVAAQIVDEAIDQVTSLRGRLGAFQRTTLETNKNALSDTLVNLTEAESSIRDADFSAETANLTRAQILVQSGTTVLQIANSNPQNVLALLR